MNEDRIDVSILMLTYYHEKYVAKALDSVLAQKTDLRYEIVVGDDASGDRTPEILREYAEKYPDIVKPVLRTENLGSCKNGLDASARTKGKYMAYLEGDDYWLDPYKMQKQYDFLEENTEYFACCGKCLIVDENGTPDYTQSPQFAENKKVFTLQDYFTTWNVPGQIGTLMRRNNLGFEYADAYEVHRNVGDKTDALIFLSQGPIYCFNEIFSAYRHVTSKDGHNHFSQHYANPYRDYDMFLYPCRLEAWGKRRLGLAPDVRLGPRRDYRFCRFVEQTVKDPSIKRLKCLGEMIAASRQPAKYSWLVLKTLIGME